MYNGYSQEQVNRNGAQKLAVTAFKNGLVSRGSLIDIPRLKGVKYLELSSPITRPIWIRGRRKRASV